MNKIRRAYVARAEKWLDPETGVAERYVRRAERKHASPDARYPLTPGQHILHLLLTVFTFGLWAPVWLVRAWRGNRPYVPPEERHG